MRTMLTVLAAATLLLGCKTRESDQAERGTQARRDLDHSPDTQARARANYANDMHERLSKIDSKIEELDRSTDPAKRELATRAKVQRTEVSQKLDRARDTTSDRWDAYRKDLDDSFAALEKELDIK